MLIKIQKHLNDAIIQLSSLSKSLQQNSVSLDKVLNTMQNNTLRNNEYGIIAKY